MGTGNTLIEDSDLVAQVRQTVTGSTASSTYRVVDFTATITPSSAPSGTAYRTNNLLTIVNSQYNIGAGSGQVYGLHNTLRFTGNVSQTNGQHIAYTTYAGFFSLISSTPVQITSATTYFAQASSISGAAHNITDYRDFWANAPSVSSGAKFTNSYYHFVGGQITSATLGSYATPKVASFVAYSNSGGALNAAFYIDSDTASCGAGYVAGTQMDVCMYRAAANVWTFNAGTSLRVPGYVCVGCTSAPTSPNAGVLTADAIVIPRSNPFNVDPSSTWYKRWYAYEYTTLPPAVNTYSYAENEVGVTMNSSSTSNSDMRFESDFYTWTQTVNGGNFVRGKKLTLVYGGTNNFTSTQTDGFVAYHNEIRTGSAVGSGSITTVNAINYWAAARVAEGSLLGSYGFFAAAPIYSGTAGGVTNWIGHYAQSSTNARTTSSYGYISQAQKNSAYHISSDTAACGSGFTAGVAVDTCLYRGRANAWTGPAGTDIYTDSGYICAGTGCSSVTASATGVYDAGVRVMSSVSCTGATCSLTNGALSITVSGGGGGVTSLAGTSGEVEVSAATGSVVVGLPSVWTPSFSSVLLQSSGGGTGIRMDGLASFSVYETVSGDDVFGYDLATAQLTASKHMHFITPNPTYTFGAAAGTGPTGSGTALGGDQVFTVQFTTGTSPATNDVVFALTWAFTWSIAPQVVFSAGNAASAAAMTSVFVDSVSTGSMTFSVGAVALQASTIYKWNFHAFGAF